MKVNDLIKTMDKVFTNESGGSKWQQQVGCSCFRELRYLDGCFITRCFAVADEIIEYARFIISKDGYSILVSNVYQKRKVNSTLKHTDWKYYDDIEKADCDYYHGIVNYSSLSEDLKGTIYENCLFKDVIDEENIGDMNYILRNALKKPKVFVKLVHERMYNLSTDADLFNYSESTEEMLGISEDYFRFIRRHNLYYEELQTLKKIKRKNFKIIHQLNKYSR